MHHWLQSSIFIMFKNFLDILLLLHLFKLHFNFSKIILSENVCVIDSVFLYPLKLLDEYKSVDKIYVFLYVPISFFNSLIFAHLHSMFNIFFKPFLKKYLKNALCNIKLSKKFSNNFFIIN